MLLLLLLLLLLVVVVVVVVVVVAVARFVYSPRAFGFMVFLQGLWSFAEFYWV